MALILSFIVSSVLQTLSWLHSNTRLKPRRRPPSSASVTSHNCVRGSLEDLREFPKETLHIIILEAIAHAHPPGPLNPLVAWSREPDGIRASKTSKPSHGYFLVQICASKTPARDNFPVGIPLRREQTLIFAQGCSDLIAVHRQGTQPEYRAALALSAQGTPSEPGFCRLVLYPSTLGYLLGVCNSTTYARDVKDESAVLLMLQLKEPGRRSSRVRVNAAFAQRYHGPLRPLHAIPPLASTTEGLMPIDRGQQRRAAKYGWLGILMGMHPNEEAICRDGRCPPDEAVFDTRLPRPPW
ncbi:hypothetical protein B0H10DRAFT_2195755 [Mycena sp. CBHHK59/15]|nr:hypothetical protein B0H10DRAFT_2195755 [Mycena sp. CBHHK59/15]